MDEAKPAEVIFGEDMQVIKEPTEAERREARQLIGKRRRQERSGHGVLTDADIERLRRKMKDLDCCETRNLLVEMASGKGVQLGSYDCCHVQAVARVLVDEDPEHEALNALRDLQVL